jgi:glycosyltransferase involved in cell wall biosynthesis
MKSDYLFSFIIPTLNVRSEIEKCMDSIREQSLKNFEVIFVDGGSTDGTIEFLNQINDFNKFNIIHQKSKGIYEAMNQGLAHATGKWIYFMGADDYLYAYDVLQKVADFANQNSELKVIYGRITTEEFLPKYTEFDLKTLLEINICHQSIFVRKDLFQQIGNFNTRYKIWADYEHNWRWFGNKKEYPFAYIDEIIAVYGNQGFSTNKEDVYFILDKPKLLVCHLKFSKKDPIVLSSLDIAFGYLVQKKKYIESLRYCLNYKAFGMSKVIQKIRDWFYLTRKSLAN